MTGLLKVRGLEKTTPSFRDRLVSLAEEFGIDPNWIASVISFESAGTFAADVTFGGGRYRGSQDNAKAVGLIQFTNVALDAMKRRGAAVTKAELAAMSAEEQLEWVRIYLQTVLGSRRMMSLDDVYMAVFAPSAVGKSDSTVLYSEPSASYTANKVLDANGDGHITRAEACAQVRSIYARAKQAGVLAEGGEGAALVVFPDSGRDSLDDLSEIRKSVADARTEICARLDGMNASLRELVARLGA